MGASLQQVSEEEKQALDTVLDESVEGQLMQQNAEEELGVAPIIQVPMETTPMGDSFPPLQAAASIIPPPVSSAPPMVQMAQMATPRPMMNDMQGGMAPPSMSAVFIPGEGLVTGPSVPGMGPTITVRTDKEAFENDGLMAQGFGTRTIRRNPLRYGGGGGGGMGSMNPMNSMGPMAPMADRYTPTLEPNVPSGSHNMPVRVTKLE